MGNGKRIVIKSKRNSSRFFAETNRFLTKCLVVLNAAYIDLLREYRLIWLITTNTNRGKKTYYLDLQQKVKSNLDAVDFVFEKFNATWGGSNDPFFAFIDLKKIASFLREAAEQMAAFHKKRNTTASIYVWCV